MSRPSAVASRPKHARLSVGTKEQWFFTGSFRYAPVYINPGLFKKMVRIDIAQIAQSKM
jgi:hypothetical protein